MMHDWNGNGWGGGWWVLMVVMMILFWGGVIWAIVTLIRRPTNNAPVPPPAAPQRTADHILHERLAKGEIEPEDYERRLNALQQHRTP